MEDITTNFLMGLRSTQQKHNVVWVVGDRLTKLAHFLPIQKTDSLDKLAQLYINEIVRLHGIPIYIVSDWDTRFTTRFWEALQCSLGTRLDINNAFHPQTDGQSERTIQILEDMLLACVLDFCGNWDDHLLIV